MASVTFFTCRIWLVVGVWWVLKGEAFSVRRILPVVGLVISFVFGFIVAPIPTLLFALSGALGLFFPQPLRSTYWIATLAKYGLSLLIQLVAVYYWNSQIIPINVDQHWYLNNINSICVFGNQKFQSRGYGRFLGLDYAARPRLRRYSIGLIASKDILIRSSLYQRRKSSSLHMNSSKETPSQGYI